MIAALVALGLIVFGAPAAGAEPSAPAAGLASEARVRVAEATEAADGADAAGEQVRLALARFRPRHARVFGDFGSGEIESPWAAVDGLHYDRILRPGPLVSIEAGTNPVGLPSPIAWDRLTEIQARGHAAQRGAMLGLYAGTLAAILYATTAGFDTGSDGPFGPDRDLLVVMAVPLAGGLTGALIGSAVPTWKTIYRSDTTDR